MHDMNHCKWRIVWPAVACASLCLALFCWLAVSGHETLAVCLAIALYVAMILFAIPFLMTRGLVWLHGRSKHFGLRDLFVATTVVAIALGFITCLANSFT